MPAYPGRPYAWTVVAILIATAILSYTDRQVLSLLVDPIRGDMGISDTQISLLLGTAFAVVYGIAGIPLGLSGRSHLAPQPDLRRRVWCGVWARSLAACRTASASCSPPHRRRAGRGGTFPGRDLADQRLFPTVTARHRGRVLPQRHRHGDRCGHPHRRRCAARRSNRALWPQHRWPRYAPWRMVLLVIGGPGLAVGAGDFAHPRARSAGQRKMRQPPLPQRTAAPGGRPPGLGWCPSTWSWPRPHSSTMPWAPGRRRC